MCKLGLENVYDTDVVPSSQCHMLCNLDSYTQTYVGIHTYMYVHNYNSAGCGAASSNKR